MQFTVTSCLITLKILDFSISPPTSLTIFSRRKSNVEATPFLILKLTAVGQ